MTLEYRAITKVNEILHGLSHITDCGPASEVLDLFERDFPREKDILSDFRNTLCDKTFELYKTRND